MARGDLLGVVSFDGVLVLGDDLVGVLPGVDVALAEAGGFGGGDMSLDLAAAASGETAGLMKPPAVSMLASSGVPTGLGLVAVWLPGLDSLVVPERSG